ncbi:PQQ-dependent sugar dehydrogenase [Agaribacter flavus]|uniref:PQQ-dependent sugar dehydrogenase n=1 Tax=Agaribacter flavus TaxID=1902781 RepID=A0ABV7FQY2_9ALTE
MFKYSLFISAIVLLFCKVSNAETFSTNFEFNNRSGAFTLFDSPNQVSFEGGQSKVVGDEEIYRSGIYAYMFDNETVNIRFETPVKSITIYLKNQDPNIDSSAFVYELNKAEAVASIEGNYNDWTKLTYTSEIGITRIEGVNASRGYAAFEDLRFTTFDDSPVIAPQGIDNPIQASIPNSDISLKLTLINDTLNSPIEANVAPGIDSTLFIAEQSGEIWAMNTSSNELTLVNSFAERIVVGGERGLLGFAFHPDFSTNGLLYTHTSELEASDRADGMADFTSLMGDEIADHFSVIAEWQAETLDNGSIAIDMTSRRQILSVAQPQGNHNGGSILFDNSGYLLIGLGDGGGADDQGVGHPNGGNGQNLMNVLGTILRIDPLGRNSENGAYGIPTDNPFLAQTGVPPEIYAYGLRNPFKLSFDLEREILYAADVGQNHIEEINIVESGDNLGWPLREGAFGFFNNSQDAGYVFEQTPNAALKDPIASYDHDEGIAVIGGHVYRGNGQPALTGRYVFGDFNGRLFFLDDDNQILALQVENEILANQALRGIAEDIEKQLYFFTSNASQAFVYRLDNPAPAMQEPPATQAPNTPQTDTRSSGGGVGLMTLLFSFLIVILSNRALTRNFRSFIYGIYPLVNTIKGSKATR